MKDKTDMWTREQRAMDLDYFVLSFSFFFNFRPILKANTAEYKFMLANSAAPAEQAQW